MIPAQVTFYVVNNLELEPEEIHEYVDNYLSALYFDGQIFGDFVTGVVNGLYTSFVYLAGSDAIQMENHTERGKRGSTDYRYIWNLSGMVISDR